MKTADDILVIGNPILHEISAPISQDELPKLNGWVNDLHSAMEDFSRKYQFGRGIAAPQLGILKRLIYLNLDKPYIIINPDIIYKTTEMNILWDDCMSFPNLLVRVNRHKLIIIKYLNESWEEKEWELEGDLAELFQHEYDHLDGILSTQRAIDEKSFKWKKY